MKTTLIHYFFRSNQPALRFDEADGSHGRANCGADKNGRLEDDFTSVALEELHAKIAEHIGR